MLETWCIVISPLFDCTYLSSWSWDCNGTDLDSSAISQKKKKLGLPSKKEMADFTFSYSSRAILTSKAECWWVKKTKKCPPLIVYTLHILSRLYAKTWVFFFPRVKYFFFYFKQKFYLLCPVLVLPVQQTDKVCVCAYQMKKHFKFCCKLFCSPPRAFAY